MGMLTLISLSANNNSFNPKLLVGSKLWAFNPKPQSNSKVKFKTHKLRFLLWLCPLQSFGIGMFLDTDRDSDLLKFFFRVARGGGQEWGPLVRVARGPAVLGHRSQISLFDQTRISASKGGEAVWEACQNSMHIKLLCNAPRMMKKRDPYLLSWKFWNRSKIWHFWVEASIKMNIFA